MKRKGKREIRIRATETSLYTLARRGLVLLLGGWAPRQDALGRRVAHPLQILLGPSGSRAGFSLAGSWISLGLSLDLLRMRRDPIHPGRSRPRNSSHAQGGIFRPDGN